MERDKLLELKQILKELRAYGMTLDDIKELLKPDRLSVPVTLYRDRDVGIMELTVRYLHENMQMSLADVARALNRDQRTVWVMHHNAVLKRASRPAPEATEHQIPIEVFRNRELGVLQSIVRHLKDEKGMRFREIGKLMNRDPRVVCTVYHKR